MYDPTLPEDPLAQITGPRQPDEDEVTIICGPLPPAEDG